jgi:AcrR family transcriptional regulator
VAGAGRRTGLTADRQAPPGTGRAGPAGGGRVHAGIEPSPGAHRPPPATVCGMTEPNPLTGVAEPSTARGEQTRRAIVSAALRLFREHGYAETTMRAIAREAGVSVGNAYYYFRSKEHLIQQFYAEVNAEHRRAAEPALASSTDFGTRLRRTLHAGIDTMTPYHALAGTFFKTAAEPTSPLSPFSPESSPARDASVALFAEVLAGSNLRPAPELLPELPHLLWLGYLGVILYWVHDRSPHQRKTRLLVDQAVPLTDRLIGLSRLRALRPVTREVVGLVRALRDSH